MKNKKAKKSLMLATIIGIIATGIVTVSAAYGYLVTFQLPILSSASSSWLTSNSNYPYATSHVNSTKNGGTYNTYYQTYYNSSAIQIGSELKMTAKGNTGNAVWKPSTTPSYSAPYTATVSSTCSGSNTSSNYCAIANSKYRLSMKNNYALSSVEIVTLFTLD